ncbi:MAG: hypothetical protein ACRCSY_09025 [Cetobacterium sp.]
MEKILFDEEIKKMKELGFCRFRDVRNSKKLASTEKDKVISNVFIGGVQYGNVILNSFYRGYFDNDKMNKREEIKEKHYEKFVSFCDFHSYMGFTEKEYDRLKELKLDKQEKKEVIINFFRSKIELLVKIAESLA